LPEAIKIDGSTRKKKKYIQRRKYSKLQNCEMKRDRTSVFTRGLDEGFLGKKSLKKLAIYTKKVGQHAPIYNSLGTENKKI